MDQEQYLNELNSLKIASDLSFNEKNDLLDRTLCFTSANLGNYLPETDEGQHREILKKILLNKKLSLADGKYSEILTHVNYENLTPEITDLLRSKPSIIYTFHFGSMQLINHFLAFNKMKYLFVASKKTLDEHLGDFLEMAEFQKEVYGELELDYIEADESTSALKMLHALKRGVHLLIYVDGNVGSGTKKSQNSNLCKIDFFNKSIYVRRGAGLLACLAGVPLIGALSYRDKNEQIYLDFADPLFPSPGKKRNEDAQRLMQAIYDNLVKKLKLYPEQWECWIYLHNNIDINDFDYQFTIGSFTQENNVCLYGFNIPDYDIFNIEDSYYLFCKKNYASYPIGKYLYDFLYINKNNSFSLEVLEYQVFKKLFENNVLLKLSDA